MGTPILQFQTTSHSLHSLASYSLHTHQTTTPYISKLSSIYPIFHNEGKQIWQCRCSLLSHILTVVMTCSSLPLRLLSHSFLPLLLRVRLWASPYVHIGASSLFSCKAHSESLSRQTLSRQTLCQQAISQQAINHQALRHRAISHRALRHQAPSHRLRRQTISKESLSLRL